MADPKNNKNMTAREAVERFCTDWVWAWTFGDNDPGHAASALDAMLRHETPDPRHVSAPVPLWATGDKVGADPSDPQELIATDKWFFKGRGRFKTDIKANAAVDAATGGDLVYVDLRIYDAEPRAADMLAGKAGIVEPLEPGGAARRLLDERPRNRNVETEALLKNRINAVLAMAKTKWPDLKSRPGVNEMARVLAAGGSNKKVEGYGEEAIRKIIAGTYKPAKDRGIPGLSSG